MKLIELKSEDIILVNKIITNKFGRTATPVNSLGKRDLADLIRVSQGEVAGEKLYPKVYHKAGLYMQILSLSYIFEEYNKQTAIASALLSLQLNNYDLKKQVTNEILTDFTLTVAAGEKTLEEVQHWFEENIEVI